MPLGDHAPEPRFQIRQCTRAECGLRFTIVVGDLRGERCPICRSSTRVIESPDVPAAGYERFAVGRQVGWSSGPPLEVMFDNIRSAWNVGSMLRSADGAGVRHVHLCGVSAAPDNPKVAKTALGAEKSLPWTFHPDGAAAAEQIKARGLQLWALEGGSRAESLFEVRHDPPDAPVVLVAGNELSGVDPGIMALCDRVVCLPMQGIKGSLNVAVAFGIAVYTIRFGMNRRDHSTGI